LRLGFNQAIDVYERFERLVILFPGFARSRYWHIADVQTALMNVRFEGINGHDADVTRCLLMTQSGH